MNSRFSPLRRHTMRKLRSGDRSILSWMASDHRRCAHSTLRSLTAIDSPCSADATTHYVSATTASQLPRAGRCVAALQQAGTWRVTDGACIRHLLDSVQVRHKAARVFTQPCVNLTTPRFSLPSPYRSYHRHLPISTLTKARPLARGSQDHSVLRHDVFSDHNNECTDREGGACQRSPIRHPASLDRDCRMPLPVSLFCLNTVQM